MLLLVIKPSTLFQMEKQLRATSTSKQVHWVRVYPRLVHNTEPLETPQQKSRAETTASARSPFAPERSCLPLSLRGIILQLTGLKCQETFLQLKRDHIASNNTLWSHSGAVVPKPPHEAIALRSWPCEELHQALSSSTTPSHKGSVS